MFSWFKEDGSNVRRQYRHVLMIAHTQLPLRLAVAAFLRTPLDDGTCLSITEMVVAAVPEEMRKSSPVLTSGQVLFPFDDSPHITHDGVILHGRSAPQRAMVYRILHQTECLPSPGCAVGLGQARPPEPGEAFAAFPFMQLHTLPAVPATSDRPAPPIPPWLMPQPVPVLPQSHLQDFVEPRARHKPTHHALLTSWEYMPCKHLLNRRFFFHEYGRRVGGVPRSSMKGKETRHDEGEKNTSNPKSKTKTKQEPQTQPKGQRPNPPHQKVFPLH